MTSLEFIEKEIAMVKKKISMAKSKFTIKGLTYYHINEIKEEINILRDRLQVLQQTKSELEEFKKLENVIEILKDRLVDYQGMEFQKRWYDSEEEYHYFLVFDEDFEIELVDKYQYEALKNALEEMKDDNN